MANDELLKLMSYAVAKENGDPDVDRIRALADLSDDLRNDLELNDRATITKLPDIIDLDVLDKMRATIGCGICPFCKNTKTLFDSCAAGTMDEINEYECEDYVSFKLFKNGRFFIPAHWEYWMHYECGKCGAAWNSGRYMKSKKRKDHWYL